MKAYEFPAKVTAEGKLELPDTLLKNLTPNQQIRIIVLVNEPVDKEDDEEKEAADWARLGTEQLFAGYSDEDAIYDKI
ncbi:hypothetical protein [Argonema galeatum]|uniref:hypothetical protein n=1 Tax=Argonema galeatum TaxID=2942762 RepID=UPI002011F735|nr:hypothetical protein [Argonema galeatum]MCL1463485.1 hypothetical protein [Argonema galeatum A003/A1]